MTGADVEALSRSFRSRVALLALVVLAGLAAALWSGTRESGIGDPEDRRRIMVVTGDREINYYAVLEQAGFEVEVDVLDDWLTEARAAAPESEAEGVALVLELADLRGFGLVVFEHPAELDFDGLELEPSLDSVDRFTERDYAVLSVGDFAFPHRATFDDPDDDPRVRLPGYGALVAVFRQELVSAREDPDRPTIEELQFEDATSLGRRMVERPAGFDEVVDGMRATIRATLDDGEAKSLVAPLETGTAIPTPDGGILLFHHELAIFSNNARSLELEAGAQMQLSWISPEALAAGFETGTFERSACPSLAGGVLPMAELPHLAVAIDGSAVAIGTPEAGFVVWRKVGPGCEWAPIAELDHADPIVLAPESAGPALVATATRGGDERGQVLVWALPADVEPDAGDQLDATVLLEQTHRRFWSPTFLDDRHLVVASKVQEPGAPAEQERVYVLDRTRPGLYLSVPLELFPKLTTLRAVATRVDAEGPELVIEALNGKGEVELVRVRIGTDAWLAFNDASPSPSPSEAELGLEGTMVSLGSEQLEFETMLATPALYGVSFAGDRVVYSSKDDAQPSELMLLELDRRVRRSLTDNELRDDLPRIAADGSFATFVSLMQVNISPTPFSVPRVLRLE